MAIVLALRQGFYDEIVKDDTDGTALENVHKFVVIAFTVAKTVSVYVKGTP